MKCPRGKILNPERKTCVPKRYKKDFDRFKGVLSRIQKSTYKRKEGEAISLMVLEKRSYIKPKWKEEPYIDNPSKMNKIFKGWGLTKKGKIFLSKLKKL